MMGDGAADDESDDWVEGCSDKLSSSWGLDECSRVSRKPAVPSADPPFEHDCEPVRGVSSRKRAQEVPAKEI